MTDQQIIDSPAVNHAIERSRETASTPAADAARLVIFRTATVLSGIWIVGMIPAVLSPDSGLRSAVAAAILFGLVFTAWLICLVIRTLPASVLVLTLTATVVAMALNTAPIALAGPYAAFVPWIDLAVLMAALLIRPARAPQAVVGISTAGFVVILATALWSGDLSESWRGSVLMAAYAVAVGMAAVGTVRALDGVAQAGDHAAMQRLTAATEEDREVAGRAERFRISRMLHDTVVNTFGAIGAGASFSSLSTVRQRCLHDLRVLQAESLATPAPIQSEGESGSMTALPVRDILTRATEHAQLLDLDLLASASGKAPEVPAQVIPAVEGSIAEALINVSKHAGTKQAELTFRSSTDRFSVCIRDSGHGYQHEPNEPGIAPTSITERCQRAGVQASVQTRPGGGTDVQLTWRARAEQLHPAMGKRGILPEALIPVTRWLSAWFLGLFVVNTLIVVGQEPVIGSMTGLLTLGTVIAAAINCAGRGVPIPWFASAALALAAGPVAYLSAAGTTGCAHIGTGWWGSLGGSLCIVVTVLLSGQVLWITATCISYLAGVGVIVGQIDPTSADCVIGSLPAILMTDVTLVTAVILFRRLLRRYGDHAEQLRASTAQTLSRVVRMRERERVRKLNLEAVLTSVRPLLNGIADGSIDPTDPAVWLQCRNDESYLRSLIRVDPDLAELGDVLVEAVQAARSQGKSLTIRSAEPVPDPSAAGLEQIREILRDGVAALTPASEATVTLFSRPGGAAMTIHLPTAATILRVPNARRSDAALFRAVEVRDEGDVMIELEWGSEVQVGQTSP